jgi:hypothetical protein
MPTNEQLKKKSIAPYYFFNKNMFLLELSKTNWKILPPLPCITWSTHFFNVPFSFSKRIKANYFIMDVQIQMFKFPNQLEQIFPHKTHPTWANEMKESTTFLVDPSHYLENQSKKRLSTRSNAILYNQLRYKNVKCNSTLVKNFFHTYTLNNHSTLVKKLFHTYTLNNRITMKSGNQCPHPAQQS